MFHKTETGSIYETDEANKKVRRLSGVNGPTARMGTDGEWKPYDSINHDIVGCMIIVWRVDKTEYGDIERTTMTSRVVSSAATLSALTITN